MVGFLVLVKNDDREKWLSMENLIKWLCKVGKKRLKNHLFLVKVAIFICKNKAGINGI